MASNVSISPNHPSIIRVILNKLPTLVMTVLVYPMLVFWTLLGILLFPVAFVLWKVITRWSPGRIMRHFIWLYGRGWVLIVSPFVRFRREGLEHLRLSRPSIIVVNHLSFFDTYCMALLPFHDVTFAVRSWPFRMFWYGRFMRLADYIDVEGTDWDAIVSAASKTLGQGGHLLFFPEGHRSRDGRLQRFYSGAFRLAVETGAPLVPLCITGTDRLLPPGRTRLQPTSVTLRALPPVDSQSFGYPEGHRDLLRVVKQAMAENITQMARR
ncbi:lysophospholipid acyltransferase family protein [Geoalkalibacter halelectricus]|uniref:1-acyl-sn-glycerol-3-phosphate acyltransferase n=1 Tax=Geoalkalibacter halelectricus TaxID=2847045 RepID=A0ABY5ZJD8_9BACT|nr:lysophospholipid acyltransferase family protein [Geoalkalibacter halelectricus]MDO3379809.1 1-acyl-sn-glycerol-3-phosphate acyltransferase [Geoalkalibacter halelectricus]UWZ79243.1 1-acyl-sn-glycerol-3-phosphate acyltransferase [Geoalkalibacter halelectricus]